MDKIGIVINTLYPNQVAYNALKNVNGFLEKNYLTNFIFFVKQVTIPFIEPECAVMRWEELWGFDGKLITTDIEGTRKALKTPGSDEVYMYVYDFEWVRNMGGTMRYEEVASVYQSPDVKLIARNKDYGRIIENLWNVKPIGIAEDFDLAEMLPLIGVGQHEKGNNEEVSTETLLG